MDRQAPSHKATEIEAPWTRDWRFNPASRSASAGLRLVVGVGASHCGFIGGNGQAAEDGKRQERRVGTGAGKMQFSSS